MDRLTNRSEEMPTPISDNAQYYAFCVNRLADYEDTGLTPDEIRDMKDELKSAKAHIKDIGDCVWLSNNEAESLCDFIEYNLFQVIRNDVDADNIVWLENLIRVWRKCGGRREDDE